MKNEISLICLGIVILTGGLIVGGQEIRFCTYCYSRHMNVTIEEAQYIRMCFVYSNSFIAALSLSVGVTLIGLGVFFILMNEIAYGSKLGYPYE